MHKEIVHVCVRLADVPACVSEINGKYEKQTCLLSYLKCNAHDRPKHVVVPLKVLVKLKRHLQ
jgi:hypothetical protein